MKKYLLELFYVLTGAFVIFCVLEIVWPGIVISRFNPNWVLILLIIIGIIIVSEPLKKN